MLHWKPFCIYMYNMSSRTSFLVFTCIIPITATIFFLQNYFMIRICITSRLNYVNNVSLLDLLWKFCVIHCNKPRDYNSCHHPHTGVMSIFLYRYYFLCLVFKCMKKDLFKIKETTNLKVKNFSLNGCSKYFNIVYFLIRYFI